MSKGSSGLFFGTSGSLADSTAYELTVLNTDSTAEVWEHLTATQPNYEGTVIPRSFEIDVPRTPLTPDGKIWTHANATEHMYEAVNAIGKNAPQLINSNPNLYSQFILYDYYHSLKKAIATGAEFGKIINVGHWEFIFAKARDGQKYPVVKHALFSGLERR